MVELRLNHACATPSPGSWQLCDVGDFRPQRVLRSHPLQLLPWTDRGTKVTQLVVYKPSLETKFPATQTNVVLTTAGCQVQIPWRQLCPSSVPSA